MPLIDEKLSDEELVKRFMLQQQAAQSESNDSRLFAGLGEAMNTVTNGISGSNQNPDYSFYRDISKSADDRVKSQETDRDLVKAYITNRTAQKKEEASAKQASASLARQESKEAQREREHKEDRDYRRNKDEADAAAKAETAAKPSERQVEAIDDFDKSIQATHGLVQDFKPGHVGVLDNLSGVEGIKRLPWVGASPETQSYHAAIGRVADVYRKLITGAGAGDKELLKIESRLPQASDDEETFKRKANDFIKEVQGAKQRYLTNLQRSGKKVEQFASATTSAPPPASTAPLSPEEKLRLETLRAKKNASASR